MWAALGSGVESNPPSFHLLTRWVESIWGEGLITTRLPEIFCFWILCLCLFHFVQRRAGIAGGFIAMTLPMLSGAYYYAYEARPLIMVAAFAAVALVCWDHANATDGKQRRWWTVALSFSFVAAFASHCYAILIVFPFALAESLRLFQTRRVDWVRWTAILLPAALASAFYIPLLRAYSAMDHQSDFVSLHLPVWHQLSLFYLFLLEGSPTVFLLLFALLAIYNIRGGAWAGRGSESQKAFSAYDLIVCVGFLLVPVAGIAIAQILHTASFARYYLSALIGLSILVAAGVSAGSARVAHVTYLRLSWPKIGIPSIAAFCVTLALLSNFASLLRHRTQGRGEQLVEPSSLVALETAPGRPLAHQQLLESIRSSTQPIAVLGLLDFLYLVHYAPDLTGRLYPVDRTMKGSVYHLLASYRRWAPIRYNAPLTAAEFADRYRNAYVYGLDTQIEELEPMTNFSRIKSLRSKEGRFLARLEGIGSRN